MRPAGSTAWNCAPHQLAGRAAGPRTGGNRASLIIVACSRPAPYSLIALFLMRGGSPIHGIAWQHSLVARPSGESGKIGLATLHKGLHGLPLPPAIEGAERSAYLPLAWPRLWPARWFVSAATLTIARLKGAEPPVEGPSAKAFFHQILIGINIIDNPHFAR